MADAVSNAERALRAHREIDSGKVLVSKRAPPDMDT